MRYKVIGWTDSDDYTYPEVECYTYHVERAIIEDIRKNKYIISGYQHDDYPECAPVLNTGEIVRYGARGWGQIMADVFNIADDNEGAYSFYGVGSDLYDETPENRKVLKKDIVKRSSIADTYRIELTKETFDAIKKGKNVNRMYIPEELQLADDGDKLLLTCGKKKMICKIIVVYENRKLEYLSFKREKGFQYLLDPDDVKSRCYHMVEFKVLYRKKEIVTHDVMDELTEKIKKEGISALENIDLDV